MYIALMKYYIKPIALYAYFWFSFAKYACTLYSGNLKALLDEDLEFGDHCFQNRTGPGGRTVKTGNRDENRFFKPKEPDFLLIPWTVKTRVGPLEPVRTVRSNPLAIFFYYLKKQLNTILFYLIKLSISYKE